MNKFEEAICGHNPLYKEGLQDKYYQGAKWAWQSRQAELDQAYEDIETFVQAHQRECDIKVQIANELKEKDKRIEEALFQMRQQALSLKEDCDGYKDPVGICQSEGIDWCVRFLEKALQGFQGDRS